ncbi:MAG: hypothetical protein SNJ55_07760 [Chloroherpetonaceae bacterium]
MVHRKKAILVLLLVVIPVLLLAASIVSGFVAIPDSDRVYVRWTSQNETGLIRYELYRQQDQTAPILLTTLFPQGNHRNYEFVDLSVSGRNVGGSNEPPQPLTLQRLTYTLKLVTASGTTELQTQVAFQTSTTRRTWGSIKALFR